MKDKSAETNAVVGETVLSPNSNNIPSRDIMTRVWSPNSAATVSTGNPYFRYYMSTCTGIINEPSDVIGTHWAHEPRSSSMAWASLFLSPYLFSSEYVSSWHVFLPILSYLIETEHRVYVCVHLCLTWSIMYVFITRDSLPDQMLQNLSERVNDWKTYANRQTVYWLLQT